MPKKDNQADSINLTLKINANEIKTSKSHKTEELVCAIVPTKEIIVYPFTILPLYLAQNVHTQNLRDTLAVGNRIIFVLQKSLKVEWPSLDQLYSYGVVANILQISDQQDNEIKVLVEGFARARIKESYMQGELMMAKAQIMLDNPHFKPSQQQFSTWNLVLDLFASMIRTSKKVPVELIRALKEENNIGKGLDVIAAQLQLIKQPRRQKLIEAVDIGKRLNILVKLLGEELELLQVEEKIKTRVKDQLSKVQHEYYLNEKLKAVQHELNELNNDHASEGSDIDKLRRRIRNAGMSDEARNKAEQELNRLNTIPSYSPEAGVIRTYVEWLVALPWRSNKHTKVPDLTQAEKILTQDHYGLNKVNERILEYLAVQTRSKHFKGPILCLVGPPGVGKTSLGESIAKATGRTFLRLSLGGVRDEAEIRGHRRTYIGSMPGRIIQKIAKAKVKNPLFMLDEIDKMGSDYHGDPAAALLEVLDPEQNHAFDDHYLEVSYDLSDVMFIATANSLDIPSALLDRLEVIRIAGYTEEEKVQIAVKYLLPKLLKEHGLKPEEISFKDQDQLFAHIIRSYTREAGVRQLSREIAKIVRKVLKSIVSKELVSKEVSISDLSKYLGVERFDHEMAKELAIGEVNGLAWTESGGELLVIEVVAIAGKGKAVYTGQLGEVMQESIQAAITVLRELSERLKLGKNFYEKWDIHIHVPDGATPKDGPSAGIAMCVGLVSAFTHISVRKDVAMTGEINLAGEVLPIGGLKEKLLAAQSAGIKQVFIPKRNERDLQELPESLLKSLTITAVDRIEPVLMEALVKNPFTGKSVITKDKKASAKIAKKPRAKR